MSAFSLLPWFGLGLPRLPRKRKPGRPRKRPPNLLGEPPPRGRGRLAEHDERKLLGLVDDYRRAQAASGRHIRSNTALLELWRDELKRFDPAGYRRLSVRSDWFQEEGRSAAGALRAALIALFDGRTVGLWERRLCRAQDRRKSEINKRASKSSRMGPSR